MSANAIRGWINGYSNSSAGPVIERDFENTKTLSFLDLMELRFIAYFRAQEVSMNTIRTAASKARLEWNTDHPLALSSENYVTDRRSIFAKSAELTGDETTYNMASGQHEMWITIEQSIEKGVIFDPNTHLANYWRPYPSEFPDIVINPRFAFGKSVLNKTQIPTKTVFNAWKAEGSNQKVADWFNLSLSQVDSAIKYELELSV